MILVVLEDEPFTPSDHKNQVAACCSTMTQSKSGANMFKL